ncbi:preprotein translocase subunit YajC [Chitinophagales bacterium]|nr:preprotein translocase subunit YajC [Chitinophagales bacterium]
MDYTTLAFISAGFLVIYFFMLRPQVNKQKAEEEYRSNLKKGDQIVTMGGIYGKVVSASETTVQVKVDEKTTLKMDKSAISQALSEKIDSPKK